MMGCGSWMWPVGLLIFGVFLIGVAVLVVWMVRQFADGQGPRPDLPEDILRRRFAAGEISQADYEQAKRTLGLR
jgi:putative membrane protein